MAGRRGIFALPARQHPVLPIVMLVAGTAPLLANGYPFAVQLAAFFAVAVGGLLACAVYRNDSSAQLHFCLLLWFLLLTWQMLSLAWSVDINSSVNEIIRTVFYLVLFWQVTATFGRPETDKLIIIIIFSGTLVAAVGLLEYLFLQAGRINATFINPNPLGIYLAMVLLLGLGRYWQRGGRILAGGLVIIAAALIFTSSRGSLLAFGGGFLICLWLTGREGLQKRLKSAAGLLLATLLLVKAIAMLAPILQPYGSEVWLLKAIVRPESFVESSLAGRLAFWRAAWRMFLQRPWTGFGPGSFQDVYFSYYDGGSWYSLYVHNHYLQVLAETGFPGLTVLLALLAVLMVPVLRLRYRHGKLSLMAAATGGAMLAFLLHIGIDFSWDMPAVTLLFFLLAASSQLMVPEEKERPPAGSRQVAAVRLRTLTGKRLLPCLLSLILLASSLVLGVGYFYDCRGEKLAAANNREGALQSWSQAVRFNPWNDSYRTHLGIGLATAAVGSPDFAAAGCQFQHALELSPYDYKHASRLAFFHRQAGNWQEAGRLFRRAVTLGGYVPSLYLDLGNYYLEAGQKQLAGEIWLEGLERVGYALAGAPAPYREKVLQTTRALHFNLAHYYEEQGYYYLAAEQLHQILAIYPDDSLARRVLEGYRKAGFI